MARCSVDLTHVEARRGFELIPAGWYVGTVVGSTLKEGAKGEYCNWQWAIEGFQSHVFDIISFGSEKMLSKQKEMNESLGYLLPKLEDTEDLHNRKCMVQVGIQKDKTGEYPDKNTIKNFKPIENSMDMSGVF